MFFSVQKLASLLLKAATHLLFIGRKYLFTMVFTFNDIKNKCGTRNIKNKQQL